MIEMSSVAKVCIIKVLAWIFLWWTLKHGNLLWSDVTVVTWQLIVMNAKLQNNFSRLNTGNHYWRNYFLQKVEKINELPNELHHVFVVMIAYPRKAA